MSRRILAACAVPALALLLRSAPALAQGAAAPVALPDLSRLPEVAPPPDSTDPAGSLRADDPQVRLLSRETRDYVPARLAASLIAREPGRYGFTAPRGAPLTYDSLVVGDATGLDVVARLGGVSPVTIRQLNPQYLRLATPPKTRSVIRVPRGLGPEVETAYAELPPSERVQYLEHVVAAGDRLADVAARYRVTPGEIRNANPHLIGTRLRPGTRLVIPTAAVPSAEAARAAGWRPARTALPALVRHRVRRGDTLPAIAESYHVSVASLCRANALPADYPLRPGMYLRIPS